MISLITPAVALPYEAETSYRFGLMCVEIMKITLGLVNAADDNLGKVLPGLDASAKTFADQDVQFAG